MFLRLDYRRAHSDRSLELALEGSCPPCPDGHTLYCPRGCNQLFTTAGRDECGACGQTMLPDCEYRYYDNLIAAGQ